MSDQNNSELQKFEKRFANAWFSTSWAEVEVKPNTVEVSRKDLITLQAELEMLNDQMETIAQKQLRLANLATFYTN